MEISQREMYKKLAEKRRRYDGCCDRREITTTKS